MSVTALVLYVVALVVLFGVRSWVQHRRTGSTGFTAMVLAQFGMVLLVPTWLSAIALAALIVAVELQVRAVEETYLRLVHGEAYADYAARTGRFVPGIGRAAVRAGTVLPATRG
jgi:protein-S-isoprenylcysteine O-methyltransferase Ste14